MDSVDLSAEQENLVTQCANDQITIHRLIDLLGCTDQEAAKLVNDAIVALIGSRT